jgi:hypothetical protein
MQVSVVTAKTNIAKLIDAAERGERVVITRNGVSAVDWCRPGADPSGWAALQVSCRRLRKACSRRLKTPSCATGAPDAPHAAPRRSTSLA